MLRLRTYFSAPKYRRLESDSLASNREALVHHYGVVTEEKIDNYFVLTAYGDNCITYVEDDEDRVSITPSFKFVAYHYSPLKAVDCVMNVMEGAYEGRYGHVSIDEYSANELVHRQYFSYINGSYVPVVELERFEGVGVLGEMPDFDFVTFTDELLSEGLRPEVLDSNHKLVYHC